MRAVVILIVMGAALAAAPARTASAGVCVDESEADDGMKLIEAFAKDKSKGKAVEEGYGWICVEVDALRLKSRIERACRKILDRDGIQSRCTIAVAAAGIPKLGDHDIYAFVVAMADDPLVHPGNIGTTRLLLLGRMGDARAVPKIVELWKETLPRAAKSEKNRPAMMGWSVWRQEAAEVLGKLGGKDEVPFLEEQAQATKDSFVAKACRAAIAAINKRLAAAPAAATPAATTPTAPAAPAPASPAAPATAPVQPKPAPAAAPQKPAK
ncbi:MAG TPA: HEAT repeat domain-containing protein [Kofleriaceae bacterium]|nr:HEAT repeat domain-containing protein [Kofleriaceae bacterium]